METKSDPRRLSSIDAATSVGRLADDVVIAVAHMLDGHQRASDAESLELAANWLDRVGWQLEHPLDLSGLGEVASPPGILGFGPEVRGAVIRAIGGQVDRQAAVDALRQLSELLRAAAAEKANRDGLERLLVVFESIARAMLLAAGSLLTPPPRSTWATTFAS